ncbi:MAG: 2-phospho-L-lactate transferase [Phototrophicaceae bacterium]
MVESRNVVLLVGGVGGAKLAAGLARVVPPEHLTIIVNTGDDFWHYGLRICPDLDTITYTLGGLVDRVNGWGIAGDTTATLDALGRLGEKPWFRLGDQDIATHLLRTSRLQAGESLTRVTAAITAALGVRCRVLPMADEPVATRVDTVEHGQLDFQDYFVRHRWQPTVRALRLAGIEHATISAAVRHAVENADLIVIGPSNPWLSIQPILSVPGLRQLIAAQPVPRVAVTPIIGGQAVKGPTVKIMRELGYTVSLETVTGFYKGTINGFIVDAQDQGADFDDLRFSFFDTLMNSDEKRIALAEHLLSWTSDWIS